MLVAKHARLQGNTDASFATVDLFHADRKEGIKNYAPPPTGPAWNERHSGTTSVLVA